MIHSIQIAGADYIVEYAYKITAKATPARGPSYASGGEPADPMEYEVTVKSIVPDDGSNVFPTLEMPEWLKDALTLHLQESDEVYAEIEEDAAERDADDRERSAEYRAEFRKRSTDTVPDTTKLDAALARAVTP